MGEVWVDVERSVPDRALVLVLARDLARQVDDVVSGFRTAVPGLPGSHPVASAVRAVLTSPPQDAAAVMEQAQRLLWDMRGQDLCTADLAGVRPDELDQVRWSTTTCWPPAWQTWVRDNSVPVGPDEWQVRPGAASADDEAALLR